MKETLVELIWFIGILILSVVIKKVLGFEYAVLGFLSIILMNQYSNKQN